MKIQWCHNQLDTIERRCAARPMVNVLGSIEAIKFRIEQFGLGPKDLVPMIGQLTG